MNRGREEQDRTGNNVTNSVRENKQQDKKLCNKQGEEESTSCSLQTTTRCSDQIASGTNNSDYVFIRYLKFMPV